MTNIWYLYGCNYILYLYLPMDIFTDIFHFMVQNRLEIMPHAPLSEFNYVISSHSLCHDDH